MRRSSPFLPCAATALVLASSAATARAEQEATRFSLSWVRLPAATSCISAQDLSAQVERRLGRPVFDSPAHADVGIEGHVERTGAAWHAVVSVTDATGAVLGTRELSSAEPSCHDLDAPLALTIALFIDPNATLGPEVATSEKAPPPPPPPSPPPARAETPAPALPARPPALTPPRPEEGTWRSSAAVGAGLALGLLPELSPGLVLRSALAAPGGWPIVVQGAFYAEQRASSQGAPIAFSLELGGLSTCPLVFVSRAAGVRACAGLDAGLMSTHGPAGDTVLTRRRFVANALVRVDGELYIGRHLFLAASPALVVPLVRDTFDFEWNREQDRVFRMASLALTGDVSLGLRVP